MSVLKDCDVSVSFRINLLERSDRLLVQSKKRHNPYKFFVEFFDLIYLLADRNPGSFGCA